MGDFYGALVNFIRNIDSLPFIILIFVMFVVGFLTLKKAVKINYNPKKIENINWAWILLVLVIFAIAIFMVVVRSE